MFDKRSSNAITKSQKTGKCQEIAEEHMINRNYYLKQLIENAFTQRVFVCFE